MQQLGNMKDNIDDLSDPEQFACLVNECYIIFFKRPNEFNVKKLLKKSLLEKEIWN